MNRTGPSIVKLLLLLSSVVGAPTRHLLKFGITREAPIISEDEYLLKLAL